MSKEQNQIQISIGRNIIVVVDSLVDSKKLTALTALSEVITKLILTDVRDKEVSLVEINEYIGEASHQLRAGKTATEVKQSSIRKLLDS